jgi:hypothetical protein
MLDETRIDTSPNSSNRKIIAPEKVNLHVFVPSKQTISPILTSEGTGYHDIDQNAPLMSDTKELFPDWVTGLEGETVPCKIVTIKLSTSQTNLDGCITATGYTWGNGKSISSTDTGHTSIEHEAKTNSDLARPPSCDHHAAS